MTQINMTARDVKALRQQISVSLQQPSARLPLSHTFNDNEQTWWLLGTLGCHLCDKAENILHIYQTFEPIEYIVLDIADFEAALMAQFATTIPVILTPTYAIHYPFSIVDLQRLSARLPRDFK